jgi:hypothetical protein
LTYLFCTEKAFPRFLPLLVAKRRGYGADQHDSQGTDLGGNFKQSL